ncbi:hypothetical protein PISMIDRAFT_216137 [Pisolithus microcarpus 441]|uniref:X-box-binding protein 1 n=1 Tax=Pisolithus microcarpus 441 TaxID=765257 RepID=A0A0D0A4J0_9AGAM|nr:hypothetical protein PISMIDRAFT_216137 [Pisolithus microcarpus 441]
MSFVDPSSLSLPMSSDEPPRKRPRSTMSPEERKEARAHRNRIAAQNSRDRRKAHFTYLERRVVELEEENRRLRAGLSASPTPSTSSAPDIEYEREHSRRRTEEQRERENQELRERIRSLEKGYEAVVRALAAHGKSLPSTDTPLAPDNSTSSNNVESSSADGSPAPSPGTSTLLSLNPSLPLSPAPTHSTIADSPITFASDSLDFPFSPAFSPIPASSSLLDSPKHPLNLSLTNETPTRHLARVATTANVPAVALQRVGSSRLMTGWTRTTKHAPMVRPSQRTRLHQMPSSRVCSRRSSRRRLLLLALYRVLALRQKRRVARRC